MALQERSDTIPEDQRHLQRGMVMDLSKLPKLSDTKSQVPPESAVPIEAQPVASIPDYSRAYPPTTGLAETWLSIGVGLFILFFYPRFLQWSSSRMFHTHFDEFIDPNTSAVVPYQTLSVFWSDLGPTLLGIVLIVDGMLLFTRRPTLILIALLLTALSTVFNLVWVVASYSRDGFAPISFLAAIFGGFIVSAQWASYQRFRHSAQRANL